MNDKVENALKRLKRILPLEEKQRASSKEIRELHQYILRSFVERGRILTLEEMAQHVSNLENAITVLRDNDMVTFSRSGDPVGAYPFTMEEREHEVQVNGHTVHAMCALDALAVSPMFGEKTQIISRCRVTEDPVNIQQSGQTIENPDEAGDIQFGIIWGAEDSNTCAADSLCMEMIFLRDSKIARQWLADDPGNREAFTLQEAVEFSSLFFVPLMRSL